MTQKEINNNMTLTNKINLYNKFINGPIPNKKEKLIKKRNNLLTAQKILNKKIKK